MNNEKMEINIFLHQQSKTSISKQMKTPADIKHKIDDNSIHICMKVEMLMLIVHVAKGHAFFMNEVFM